VIVAHRVEELAGLEGPLAVSVGVFDGVHRGHRAVFEALAREAEDRGARSLVVTLDPHPLEILRPEAAPPLLTTPAERARLLSEWATGAVLVYPFDRETAALGPTEFLRRLVPPGARLASLVVGYDFRMGRGRSGGFEELKEQGDREGWRVVRVEPTRGNGEPVSSSRIRALVAEGRLGEAERLLGHPYGLQGRVVPGRGVGRTLSFPTANVDVGDERKLLPRFGVYAVRLRMLDGGSGELRPGVANIGIRPTFGDGEPTVEVHLPGWEGDLTGTTVCLEVVERIRDERPFPDPEALAARIAEDVERARKILRERD
jgi:riboflavin kinase/FMN adenylyltransferase